MLLFVGIARIYGPETFGQFTAAHVYLTLFLYLADFGIDQLTATEIARDISNAQAIAAKFYPLKIIAGTGATIAMWVAAMTSGVSSGTSLLMMILSASLLGTTLSTYYFAIGRGFEQLHHETIVVSFQQGILLAAMLFLAVFRLPIIWVVVAFVLSRNLALVLIRQRVRKSLRVDIGHITFRGWSKTLVQGIPWGVNLLGAALFFQLDTLLLAAWKGDHAVGIYQSAMKLAVVVLAIPDVIVAALLPVFARLYVEDRVKWKELGRIASRTMLYLGLPFALVFVVYPEQVLAVVYGAQIFQEAVPVLRLLGAVLVIRFSVETYGLVLTTTQNQSIRMWIMVGVTIFNFALNWFAIPRYGVEGAIAVSVASNAVVGICYVLAARGVAFSIRLLLASRPIGVLSMTTILGILLWTFLGSSVLLGTVIAFGGCGVFCYFVGYSRVERKMVFELPSGIA